MEVIGLEAVIFTWPRPKKGSRVASGWARRMACLHLLLINYM